MRAWRAALALGTGVFGSTVVGASLAAQAPTITVAASQRVISITPRYEGDLVRVQGTAPTSSEIVLKLTSPREAVVCSQKDRVGPFWLSVRQVRFRGVPRMFKVKSTAPLDDILPTSEEIEYGLGRVGLKASMAVEGDRDRSLYLDELILIRERDRRFSFAEHGVRRDGDAYEASFFWPPDGPTGSYRIEAYAVEGGRVVGTAETSVEVRAVGVEAWIRGLARDHGVLYGLFSVGLAALAGLGVSFLLGGRRRAEDSPTPAGAVSERTAE
jgi:uncharacterized protein (TIGR02186 family)